MRIAVAEIAQETDSFSPLRADLSEFESYGLYRGLDVIERMRGAGPIGGLLDVVAEQSSPVELVPLIRAWGGAGGTILDETFAQLKTELLDRLRAAGPVDAVFLVLHGAAACESEDDLEGIVLEEVRRVVGERIPIVVPFDHHANITTRKMRNADLLVGHETQPHDPIETGRKTARLLFRMLAGEISPVRAWQKIPMITPQDQFLTAAGPMKTWFDRARAFEQQPGVLDVSPYPMQPWLDVAEGGWAVVVHTDDDKYLARRVAAEMAELAWSLRKEFWRSERVSPKEAVAQAVNAEEGLVILSDTGDSVYGGAPGDNTTLLRELLAQGVPCSSLIPVVDAEAVATAISSGVSSPITLTIGGRHDRQFSRPVTFDGRVAAISEGVTVEIPDRGVCHIGRTALVECGAVRIVLLDNRSFAINHPILYTHLGIDVDAAKLVVVKTASNFQFFAPWRKRLIRVDTPGTTQSNLGEFHWQRLPRPIDPFEELPEWKPTPALFAT
ncbi:MAG: M81 family metallopeptidase [Planctomycetaceae bacterium]